MYIIYIIYDIYIYLCLFVYLRYLIFKSEKIFFPFLCLASYGTIGYYDSINGTVTINHTHQKLVYPGGFAD